MPNNSKAIYWRQTKRVNGRGSEKFSHYQIRHDRLRREGLDATLLRRRVILARELALAQTHDGGEREQAAVPQNAGKNLAEGAAAVAIAVVARCYDGFH